MNIQDIHLLYDYNYWANRRILTASANVAQERFVAPASFPFGGLRGTLTHILDSEWSWRYLLQGVGSSTELQEFDSALFPELKENDVPTPAAMEERWRIEETAMRDYLASLRDEDMENPIRYKVGDGPKRDRILWHCLLHVVNHGTQHRSEAAALLTDYDHSPGDLDFSVFMNDHKLVG